MEKEQARNPAKWIDQYADELYRFALSRTSREEVAQDLVQETFLAALRGLESFKGESSERTWLYTILKNKIADHYRKASTRFEVAHSSLTPEEDSISFIDKHFHDDGWEKSKAPKEWSIDYSLPLETQEFQTAFENCLQKLPENGRTIIVLKFIDEKESDDICKELNITSSNYWVIVHRVKLQLRACLELNWFKP